jgi:hypothetical protein
MLALPGKSSACLLESSTDINSANGGASGGGCQDAKELWKNLFFSRPVAIRGQRRPVDPREQTEAVVPPNPVPFRLGFVGTKRCTGSCNARRCNYDVSKRSGFLTLCCLPGFIRVSPFS